MGKKVVVVGGGAAGIIAAWSAARNGASVTLLEKTERLGTKILISGGGKCNITHDGPIESVIKAFRPAEARFIRPACYRFPNTAVLELLTSRGLRVYTRPDGRIFPVEQTAKDVVRILTDHLNEAGVHVKLQRGVTGIERAGPGWLVQTARATEECEALVVTTGGSSYPKSGTTGDGWGWLRGLGHTIVDVRAALAPMDLDEQFPAGVALRDIELRAKAAGKVVAKWRGDLLFTHHGVSGPCALGVSRGVAEALPLGKVSLWVDLAPDMPFEALQARIRSQSAAQPMTQPRSLVPSSVPESLVGLILRAAEIDAELRIQSLTKKDLNRLVEALKAWPLGEVTGVPLEKGEVVAGGVSLDEVDPQTHESRVAPRLFLAGEILDIAGPVGGYNLQAAFATGFVAGESAALVEESAPAPRVGGAGG